MRSTKTWETPRLLVLVRSAPEDGVMQVAVCKFANIAGPFGQPGDNCRTPPPGELVDCLGIQAS